MRHAWFAAAALAAFATACSAQEPSAPAAEGAPVETRAPNAPDQRPAFEGQTRAPGVRTSVALAHQVVVDGLEHPWGLAQLPDGRWLVTERPGRLRIVGADGTLSAPVQGLPEVYAQRQGGLLDIVVGPTYARDGLVYWSYSEPRGEAGNGTAVARGRLSADGTRMEDVQVIFRAVPPYGNGMHYGSSLTFDPQGRLYITVGERSDRQTRPQAQQLDSHYGKTIRINADGSVPADNPFVNRAGALPEIFSWGHRNAQGAATDPAGRVWTIEHGARGGDELNLEVAGANYGWGDVTYGIEYNGDTIGEGITQREGVTQPNYYWDPVIAPGGMTFYDAALVPEWRGNAFVAALAGEHLARLVIEGDRVVGEERLLTDLGERVRDVTVGADGALYVVTDEDDGKVVRLAPAG
ncbi:MAG: PQQ-dependent sugar dehydrogenase [Brevundimonas sp.]